MTTPVQISIEDLAGAPEGSVTKLIKVSGQLDESNVDDEAKKVYAIIDAASGKLNLVFDFSGLEYMNSKSIGYLTDWYSKVTALEGKMLIASAKDNILDILQVVGLTQLIPMHATLEEAKAALK